MTAKDIWIGIVATVLVLAILALVVTLIIYLFRDK